MRTIMRATSDETIILPSCSKTTQKAYSEPRCTVIQERQATRVTPGKVSCAPQAQLTLVNCSSVAEFPSGLCQYYGVTTDRPCPVRVGVTRGRAGHCLWNHELSKAVLLQFVELESRCARQRTEGSNPSLSAIPEYAPPSPGTSSASPTTRRGTLVSQRSSPATAMPSRSPNLPRTRKTPHRPGMTHPLPAPPQRSTPQHVTPPEAFPHKHFSLCPVSGPSASQNVLRPHTARRPPGRRAAATVALNSASTGESAGSFFILLVYVAFL